APTPHRGALSHPAPRAGRGAGGGAPPRARRAAAPPALPGARARRAGRHRGAGRRARERRRAGGMSRLARTLESRRIILCVGSGGVGKTTTAAALAVEAARRGRRTAVLTVDPAQR